MTAASPRRRLGRPGGVHARTSGAEVHARVQYWHDRIRGCLPDGGSLVVTLHEDDIRGTMVSFRAQAGNETFISEARDPDVARAVEQAGSYMFERLITPGYPGGEEPTTVRDRLRRFFREAS